MKFETLIVDDEPLARVRLRTMLRDFPDIEIVGECANGIEAAECITGLQPDLVFLDIQMPGMDGFEVIASLGSQKCPFVVFVTAYSERAVEAFKVDALDYLLKPFDQERLVHTLERVRARQSKRELPSGEELFNQVHLASERSPLKRLAAKSGNKTRLISVDEIEWIESAGNYVRIHHGGQVSLLRGALKRLEERLDQDCFARIHRSTIVHLDQIESIEPTFHGDFVVILKSGKELNMSRNYKSLIDNGTD